MASIQSIRKAERADGPATIMAIGTANPPHAVDQSTYADFYFRITNNEHKLELKEKFKRICKSLIVACLASSHTFLSMILKTTQGRSLYPIATT